MNTLLYWLHLIGIVFWAGGIFMHVLVVMPSLQVLGPPDRRRLMAAYVERFTPLNWGAVILAGVTGLLMVNRVVGFSGLVGFGSSYSNILLAKIILVAGMIFNGIYVGTILVPKIASLGPSPSARQAAGTGKGKRPAEPPPEIARLQKRLSLLGGVQVGLVAAVLLLVALR